MAVSTSATMEALSTDRIGISALFAHLKMEMGVKIETQIKLIIAFSVVVSLACTYLLTMARVENDKQCRERDGNPVFLFCFDKNLTKGVLK